MTLFQAAVYGAVQGLTEFLPISSSAHLSLLPWLLGWKDPGLAFDVALHIGTLFAVLGYFWRDWLFMARGALRDPRSRESRLLALIAAATVPAVVAGLTLGDYAETVFRRPPLTAAMLIAFGLWLGWADRNTTKKRTLESVDWKTALLVGFSQALAIVPGVSRSGVTITAGLLEGLSAESATRFSFLLSTPIILGAALHQVGKLDASSFDAALFTGIAVSALTGWLAIRFLLRFLGSGGFRPFVWYRLALGALILGLSVGR